MFTIRSQRCRTISFVCLPVTFGAKLNPRNYDADRSILLGIVMARFDDRI
jgi:hypothetical protein